MGKNIFCALVIVGFCFGQSIWLKENPKINLPMPISSANGTNEIAMGKISFYSAQNLSLVKSLSPNVLFMQVEGESLQPKTPFWKQAGIYGLEFVGAECGVVLSSINAAISSEIVVGPEGSITKFYSYYVIGNMLIASTCTWFVGTLVSQKGHWWSAAIGTGLGSMLGLIPEFLDPGHTETLLSLRGVLPFFTPALGAVLGFNL